MTDRQTVDVIELDGVEGRLTWRNGPAVFHPHGGEPRPVEARDGGADKAGAWIRVDDKRARVVQRGLRHDRFYSPIFGDGWLVTGSWREPWHFEVETDGRVERRVSITIRAAGVGRADYYRKAARAISRLPKMDDPDERNWVTYETTDGSLLSFRRGGPPHAPEAA